MRPKRAIQVGFRQSDVRFYADAFHAFLRVAL